MTRLTGSCLCGAISYRCDAPPLMTAICHCRNCQKQSGSSFSVNVVVPRGSIRIEGPSLKIFEDTGDSGLPLQRIFCSDCGTPIMSITASTPDVNFIKAGTLDDISWLNPSVEIWCESAQPWVKTDASRQRINRNPPMAA